MKQKSLISILIVSALIGGLVIGLTLLKEQQLVEKKAVVPNGPVIFKLIPTSSNIAIGSNQTISARINTSGVPIKGYQISAFYSYAGSTPEISIPNATVNITEPALNTCLQNSITTDTTNKKIVIKVACGIALSQPIDPFSSTTDKEVFNFTLSASAVGSINIAFDNSNSFVTKADDNSDILATPIGGTYTASAAVPTNTPTATLTPTPTLPTCAQKCGAGYIATCNNFSNSCNHGLPGGQTTDPNQCVKRTVGATYPGNTTRNCTTAQTCSCYTAVATNCGTPITCTSTCGCPAPTTTPIPTATPIVNLPPTINALYMDSNQTGRTINFDVVYEDANGANDINYVYFGFTRDCNVDPSDSGQGNFGRDLANYYGAGYQIGSNQFLVGQNNTIVGTNRCSGGQNNISPFSLVNNNANYNNANSTVTYRPVSYTISGNQVRVRWVADISSSMPTGTYYFYGMVLDKSGLWHTGNNSYNWKRLGQADFVAAGVTSNNPNTLCNTTCGSNFNCQSPLFCHKPDPNKPYDGFCRNPYCPTDDTCGCSPGQVRRVIYVYVTPTPSYDKGYNPIDYPTPTLAETNLEVTATPYVLPTEEPLYVFPTPTQSPTNWLKLGGLISPLTLAILGGLLLIVILIIAVILASREENNPPPTV